MPAMKLRLTPGISKDGPDYSRAGLWIDCNLMRWYNGVLMTIGGWQQKLVPSTMVKLFNVLLPGEFIRSGITQTDLFSSVTIFLGSNTDIYTISPSSIVTKVTPAGFIGQPADAAKSTGYGNSTYGTATYGTPRPGSLAAPPIVFSWGFSLWGQDVIACARSDDGLHLYVKQPSDTLFVPLANSPTGTYDVLVTAERIVMAVGTDTDQRIVNWSDRENNTSWVPTPANMAGFYRLPGKGRLLSIKQVQSQILILGDNEAYVGQFVGAPYIYGFNKIGTNCGTISPLCVITDGSICYWFGNNTFWKYDGTLSAVPCTLLTFLLEDMSSSQQTKMNGMSNASFNEIWWFYQSNDSDECDSYIVYNYAENIWYNGRMPRTFGLDAVPLRYVLMTGSDGLLYDHEIPGAGYAGATPFIASGPLETDAGSRLFGISYIFPDDTASDGLTMDIEIRNMPKQPPVRTVSYTLADPTSTTGVLGRDLRIKFEHPNSNEMWELGDVRVTPIGSVTGRR